MPVSQPIQPTSALIRRLALQRGLDPAAVLAVASTEGGLQNREGDIGDLSGGGSFGPFQLYTKGALPAQYRGKPRMADTWAWSPAGIDYALGRMVAAGAKGLRGENAINTIVRKFERPADPNSQVSKALGLYGRFAGGAQPGSSLPSALTRPSNLSTPADGNSTQDSTIRNALIQGLASGRDVYDVISGLPALRSAPAIQTASFAPQPLRTAPVPSQVVPSGGKGIKELIYDPVGSIFDGVASNKPYGGHGKHLHFAPESAQQMLNAISLARQLGLAVRENPYTDPVDPVHTKGSHHYQLFPGKYNGRSLGRAADISGNAKALRTLYQRLAGL